MYFNANLTQSLMIPCDEDNQIVSFIAIFHLPLKGPSMTTKVSPGLYLEAESGNYTPRDICI